MYAIIHSLNKYFVLSSGSTAINKTEIVFQSRGSGGGGWDTMNKRRQVVESATNTSEAEESQRRPL